MFILNEKEIEAMVCHFGTPFKRSIGKTKPFAFTEHGILMLSSVLNSPRAIQINIQIMRIFTRFRQMIITHKKLAERLRQLEQKHKKHDDEIHFILTIIQKIVTPPKEEEKKIGFLR
jgi:hypothetical protein